jgi:hypothetical protein
VPLTFDKPNYAYQAEPTPLLKASPDFWWMSEVDRANAFEARALAYGGQGYRYHPELGEERTRER